MAETIRSFIAVELPQSVRELIGRVQQGLQRRGVKARWVKPGNIHLTVHFFGDISPEQTGSVAAAMAEAAGCGPIRLEAKGIGVFPGIRRARVVWAGVSGDVAVLAALQRRLAAALGQSGFPVEDRPFRPHLTLGRFKKSPAPAVLADAIEAEGGFAAVSFQILQLVLFESRLTPGGAIYRKIHEISLDAGPGGSQPAPGKGRTK